MAGAVLQAAALKVPVMLDGAASCLAALAAVKYNVAAADYVLPGMYPQKRAWKNC